MLANRNAEKESSNKPVKTERAECDSGAVGRSEEEVKVNAYSLHKCASIRVNAMWLKP
jgi:hypothetical protein